MSEYSTAFWIENVKHHALAERYERGITLQHPKQLTGRSERGVSWCNCSWCATRVKYPAYRGESV